MRPAVHVVRVRACEQDERLQAVGLATHVGCTIVTLAAAIAHVEVVLSGALHDDVPQSRRARVLNMDKVKEALAEHACRFLDKSHADAHLLLLAHVEGLVGKDGERSVRPFDCQSLSGQVRVRLQDVLLIVGTGHRVVARCVLQRDGAQIRVLLAQDLEQLEEVALVHRVEGFVVTAQRLALAGEMAHTGHGAVQAGPVLQLVCCGRHDQETLDLFLWVVEGCHLHDVLLVAGCVVVKREPFELLGHLFPVVEALVFENALLALGGEHETRQTIRPICRNGVLDPRVLGVVTGIE